MTDRPMFPISWASPLYASDLQARIDALFDEDENLSAIITRRYSQHSTYGHARMSFDPKGCEKLTRGPSGTKIQACSHPLLDRIDPEDHNYINHLVVGTNLNYQSYILLHRNIVLVIPDDPKGYRSLKDVKGETFAVLANPRSAHERIALTDRLAQITVDAADLISHICAQGIHLVDHLDILPDPCIELVPGSLQAPSSHG